MKLTGKSVFRNSNHCLGIQSSLALILVILPTLISGYNPPRDQQPPSAPGGGSSFRSIEMGHIFS